MKKLAAVCAALFLALLPALSALAEAAEAPAAGWEEILSGLDGVVSVERVPLQGGQHLDEKYLLTFSQPLDWTNPDAAYLSLIGSVLIFCVGLNLVWGKKVRVANMLPALVLAVAAAFIPWTF